MSAKVIDFAAIAASDWLTEDEAAAYCKVAKSTFLEHARARGIQARRFMGRKLYAKADLYQAISGAQPWQRSIGGQAEQSISQAQARTSTGARMVSNGADLSARLIPVRLRGSGQRRKRS